MASKSRNSSLRRIFGSLGRQLKWSKIILSALTCLTVVYILASISGLTPQTSVQSSNSSSKSQGSSSNRNGLSHLLEFSFLNFLNDESDKLLAVDTPACKIPQSDVFPAFYKNNWNWSSPKEIVPKCDQELKLFYFVKLDEVIKVTYPNLTDCSLKHIIRDPTLENDKKFTVLKEIKFYTNTSRYIVVADIEMFQLVCGKYVNFEANLLTKAEAERKIEYWNKKKNSTATNTEGSKVTRVTGSSDSDTEVSERPTSILWLGIDSTSRRHMQRSLPKTLKLFKKMGFIEFEGFHSTAPNTAENMIPFTMGYTQKEQREKCQESWSDPIDDCPLIWKHFNERNYVTKHLEDGSGSFHWGNGGGFIKTPMDYYIHPLFLAHKKEKENHTMRTTDCMSTEGMPNFILRYEERFLQKFNTTPFFSFNWFGNPVHDYDFALPNLDVAFADLFSKISQDVNFLRNTLILVNADHGNRYGLFSSKSVEGFLERSLPPLYMRIPENLIQKFPGLNLKKFAEANSKLLTTSLDIHHTLLHVLDLNDKMNLTEKPVPVGGKIQNRNISQHQLQLINYQPVLADRSSLFALIRDNRTCDSVHISKIVCACNVNTSPEPVQDTFKLTRLIDYAVGELNKIVQNSTTYKDSCEEWENEEESLISADVLEKRENSSLILLKFELDEDSLFEVKLRVSPVNATYDLVETEGEYVRISTYKHTSWCVREVTAHDKRMKDFCLCKEELRTTPTPKPETTPEPKTETTPETTPESESETQLKTTSKP